jgi:hypothetical protein
MPPEPPTRPEPVIPSEPPTRPEQAISPEQTGWIEPSALDPLDPLDEDEQPGSDD